MPFIIISSLAMACQTLVLRSSQSTSNVIFISHINWQVKTKIYVKEILVCLLLDFGYDQDFFFSSFLYFFLYFLFGVMVGLNLSAPNFL